MNDIIWLLPFALILYNAYKHEELLDNELMNLQQHADENFLELYISNKGNNLFDYSFKQPILLVFLRHFGCTFCKDTLNKIHILKNEFKASDTKIILINMLSEVDAAKHLDKYDLSDLDYVADEESLLYKAFQLNRGKITQLFGLKVFFKGIYLWITQKLFISSSEGTDIYQMPGVFLVEDGKIIKQFNYDSVADEPPFVELTQNIKAYNY